MSMNISRKEFLVGASALAALPGWAEKARKQVRAMHLKIGSQDAWSAPWAEDGRYLGPRTKVDLASLERRVKACKANGVNLLLLEIGEGVALRCNAAGNLEGALPPAKLNEFVRKTTKDGLKVVPLVNFSSAHCGWMGLLCRMLSTSAYKRLAQEAIREVHEIFEKPNLVHIGMDDETALGIQGTPMAQQRRAEVLWDALNALTGAVESAGAKAWMWSDAADDDPKAFVANVSKGVLQSPRYPVAPGLWVREEKRTKAMDGHRERLTSLAEAGYRVVPACTTTKPHLAWAYPKELNLAGNPAEVRQLVAAGARQDLVRGFVCSPRVEPNAAGDRLFAESCGIFASAFAS